MKLDRTLISAKRLQRRVRELAKEIEAESKEADLVLVGVLRGAFVFLADLLRALELPASVDFIAVSSYGAAMASRGEVRIVHDLRAPVAGRDVVVVEDIVDTGHTLQALYRHLSAHRPRSLRSCALLDKPSRRLIDVRADWVGFTIPDAFIVGYGLDYDERFRGLPYLATLKPDVAAREPDPIASKPAALCAPD